jgi:lysine 2,3-aminomutase
MSISQVTDVADLTVEKPQRQAVQRTLFDSLAGWETLSVEALKPPVSQQALRHRDLRQGEFWRDIPAFADVDTDTFLDHSWQARNSVTNPARLKAVLQDRVDSRFYDDLEAGYKRAPMAIRISPYILSLMNWDDPHNCPLRTQFVPLNSHLYDDHPLLDLDSLHERADSPVPGLTHRYGDKVLFLPLDTCPVYCRYCTRSYSIGTDTEEVEKTSFRVNIARWQQAFAYLASRPEVEDVVVSGGDSFNLRPDQLEAIGMTLLGIPNIRRIRFATKGIAVMPQKILTHHEWVAALTSVAQRGRQLHKEVVVHTHFGHPNEITWISQQAMNLLHERGIKVRNQAVMLRGVNDSVETMSLLVKRLGFLNVEPYYVYLCDMVKGVEDLRTSLAKGIEVEKGVRGTTAGFNTPTFVCDTPGGGGKRCLHSYEVYNRETGIAIYTAPSVKPGKYFIYCDPLHTLSENVQKRWGDPAQRQEMIDEALAAVRA